MTLRVAFLGYRFMGRAHANALARLPMFFPDCPDVERSVLIGRDKTNLEAAADRLGFAETATDWRSVLDDADTDAASDTTVDGDRVGDRDGDEDRNGDWNADESVDRSVDRSVDVDVFYNLGPNALHPEPTIAALEQDIHVLCEKPLAGTLDGAKRMAAAARESEAHAGIAFNYRFLPAIRYAKSLIENGELGTIRQFRGRYLQNWLVDPTAPWSWRLDEETAGSGALGDLGAHTIDLGQYLVGDIQSVSGHLRTYVDERPDPDGDGSRQVTVDDAATAQLDFDGVASGTIEVSRVAPGHENDQTISVHGTDGSIRFSLERLNELAVCLSSNRGYETVLITGSDDPYLDHWWPPGHVLGWEHAIVHENVEFLRSIDQDERFRPDFEDGLAIQRVLDAIERSHDTGEWVLVD